MSRLSEPYLVSGRKMESAREYWLRALSTDYEVRPIPVNRSGEGRGSLEEPLSVAISGATFERLSKLTAGSSFLLYVALLAAVKVCLYKFSRGNVVAVGGPPRKIEGEALEEPQTLVIVDRVEEGMSFRTLLLKIKETVSEAYRYQDYPLEELVKSLNPDGRKKLLPQVLLAVKDFHLDIPSLKSDLSLKFERREAEASLVAEFAPSLFDPNIIRRFTDALLHVLDLALQDTDSSVESLIDLTPMERRQLMSEWNNTGRPLQGNRCVHELFVSQAVDAPDRVALICDDRYFTYRELNRKANQLAHYLIMRGVRPETRVALCLERGLEIVVGIMGVLKAGGAYVPLDPGYPSGRLAYMLNDAQAMVLLTQRQFLSRLPSTDTVAVCLDEEWERIGHEIESEPESQVVAENLAYVIYTSGSTGEPKGVAVQQQSLAARILALLEVYELTAADRLLQFVSPSFDAFGEEVFTTLSCGASLVIDKNAVLYSAHELLGLVERLTITTLHTTAAYWHQLVDQLSSGRRRLSNQIRLYIAGGESPSVEKLREWADLTGHRSMFFNAYGPTEATITSTVYGVHLGEGEVQLRNRAPIGRPIANTQAYILDASCDLVSVGGEGELYIGGAGIARGYLGAAEKSAERFVPHPFSEEAGARLYRTGDLARRLIDGNLEFMGRIDEQVKIRGYRVELGEIEIALNAHPGVKQSAVVVSEGEKDDARLIAYVVGEEGITAPLLKRQIRERLPEYMVPESIRVLAKMPMTENGKIDRRSLQSAPLAKDAGGQIGHDYVGPRTPIEEILVGIFGEVLNLDRVGIRDGFFEIGGHSLLATRVASRVRNTLGVEISIKSIFEDPTAEGLARIIEDGLRGGEKETIPTLVRTSREGGLPLSFAQQRLWFLDQLVPDNPFYNIPGAVMLEGQLSLEALEKVINEIIRRHETLRTRIEVEDGEPVQLIDEWKWRSLNVEDLTGIPPELKAEAIGRTAKQEAGTGFDLKRGPLLRVRVLKLEEEEHVLFFTMHHIVSDGWSMAILVREVGALYEAINSGAESPLPDLEIQYADYSVWQRGYITGEVLAAEVGYWKEQLKGAAALDLPTDHARPAVPSYRGGKERLWLNSEVSESLRRLTRRTGSTLFMALMAAFKVLLMRYSGEEDVVVGTAIANRTRKEVEGLIGFFINTLVMRTDLGGNPSFKDLVRREREVALGAYARQEVPFEKLVEEINPERDLSRSPLFQVMMILQNAGQEALEIKGLKLRDIGEETGIAKFDLMLVLAEGDEGIAGSIEYSRDLYGGETIRKMAGHFEKLIAEVVGDEEKRIGEIELMSAAEKKQIVEEWNQTETGYGETRLAHDLIAEQERLREDAVAVKSEEGDLSYGELGRRSSRLAHYLRSRGVGREDLVGICVERSVEMVIAILGVLKAGAAYVPIDQADPKQRMEGVLEDARVKLLLTQERLAGRFPAHSHLVARLDTDWDQMESHFSESPAGAACEEGLAYVIYTSGSTGRPKGVMNTHRGIRNRLLWMQEKYGLDETDRILQKTTFSFDVSVWEFLWTLMTGATLVMARPEGHKDSGYLLKTIKEEEITTIHFVPSMLGAFLEERVEEAGSLRRVICSGEALTQDLEYRLRSRTRAQVSNLYGPTEAAIDVTYWISEGEGKRPVVPIGKPIANTQMYVLDRMLEPAPVGVRGEIYIAGMGLARGYVGRPELTGEKFLPNRFAKRNGERLYRTGDVGRYLEDGNIEFVGRADDQVKVRGYRIELGEISAVLNEQRGVKQSVVVAREDGRAGKRLIAYVVGEAMETEPQLKRRLKERLPEYMVPDVIMALEEMPLTSSGKIDRKRLPVVESRGRRLEQEYVGARTLVEEIAAGIFEEVLKVDRVGIRDNFFEIGGHSLLATQVVSRVRSAFGVEFEVKGIFEEATVEGLAARIVQVISGEEKEDRTPLSRTPREGRLPLSFPQQRLWFLLQSEPGGAVYNISVALRLEGRLNPETLESVINQIVSRHEVLRTRIEVDNGEPAQVIDEWRPQKLEIEDLTSLTREDSGETVSRMAREEAETRFELERGPLMRVKAVRLGEKQHVLFFTMSQMVSDAWSIEVLLSELRELYEAMDRKKEAPLPELEIQYGDYAYWQRRCVTPKLMEKHLAYWKNQLGGALSMELPADHPRQQASRYSAEVKSFSLPAELHQSLKVLSRREGVTRCMVLLAAFKTLLYRYTAQEDILVSTFIANRDRNEIEPLMGRFMSMLPVRTDLGGNPRFRELLRIVREAALGAYFHRYLPFESLPEEMSRPDASGTRPLFNVAFVEQNARGLDLRMGDLVIEPLVGQEETARFDLTLRVKESLEGMQVCWVYRNDLFAEKTVIRMHHHFETLLLNIVDRPEARLTTLKMTSRGDNRLTHMERGSQEESDRAKLTSMKRKGVNLSTEPV